MQPLIPYRKKDIDKEDNLLRISNKLIPELNNSSNESYVLKCGLTPLGTRRLR
jgi:hypothetical protein